MMAGLLGSQSPLAGLLAMIPPPVTSQPIMADAADEAMAARNPNGLMAPRQRERVNPLRVLDRFLFTNDSVGGAIDNERARLTAEANAPAMAEQQQRLRDLVAQMAPQAQLAYALNPEKFGESLSEQFRPQVIGKGGVQSVIGENRTVSAPGFEQRGKTLYREDPINGVQPVMDIGPTYAEDVAAQNAITGRMNAATTAANSGFTLGDNQQRYAPDGTPIAENVGAPKPPTAQQMEAQGALTTLNTEVLPTLQQMRSALQSGDVITGFGAEARLQAARALAATGNEEARRKVAATEAYRNSSGRLRVGMAKSLGANPSNADILLLEKITAGDIGQNQDSLLATIDQGLSFANSRVGALGSQIGSQPALGGGAPIRVTSVAQARALPSGTRFIDPNGVERIVP